MVYNQPICVTPFSDKLHNFAVEIKTIKIMLGNFTFHNPTKLHFGEDSLSKLSEELKNYGKKVMLCYARW